MIPLWMALVLPAWAQDDEEVEVHGEWRVIGSTLSDFPLDPDGTTAGQGEWLDHRLRTGTRGYIHPLVQAKAEVDLAVGTVLATDSSLQQTPDERRRYTGSFADTGALVFRELAATTVLGNTQIEAGLVSATWGLGMVANDGRQAPLFGRSDFGDRTLRLRATQLPDGNGPTPRTTWLHTVAVDLVIADEIAKLSDGQKATQLILSTMALGRRGSKAGAYMVARQQWENERDRSTQAFVIDGFGDAWHDVGDDLRLRTAAEVAGVAGMTNRATTYQARDRVGILALNATGALVLSVQDDTLLLHLLSGYASGDGNPDDGISHEFSFDRDFGVGMVLFDEVIASIDSQSWNLVNDPGISGQPPDGSELLVSEGAFKRAAFLQPAVQMKPHPWVDLRMGTALSWSTALFAHPLYSTRNGGTPTNHLESPVEKRYLGGELDWSIGVLAPEDEDWPDRPRYGVQLQGGHLGLGDALIGPGMPQAVHLFTATGRVLW